MSLEVDPQSLSLENIVLSPLSVLYYLGWQGYELGYKLGLKHSFVPEVPVIVVGNLTVGGMGKTPLTAYLARLLTAEGHPVVIGASGYGAPRSKAASIAPDGPLDAREWGDEPALFRWLLPEIPIIVGRRRVLAAQLAKQHFPDRVLLMDDGFQHKPLRPDLSILLDPPSVRNPLVLPAGPYRQPRSHRRRADILLPDDYALISDGTYFLGPNAERVSLEPQPIQILTAIAKPYRFVESLTQMGFKMVKGKHLGDHDPLTAGNLLQGLDPTLPLVVTAKDYVKLSQNPSAEGWRIWVGNYDVRIEQESEFLSALLKKLDEIKATKAI